MKNRFNTGKGSFEYAKTAVLRRLKGFLKVYFQLCGDHVKLFFKLLGTRSKAKNLPWIVIHPVLDTLLIVVKSVPLGIKRRISRFNRSLLPRSQEV